MWDLGTTLKKKGPEFQFKITICMELILNKMRRNPKFEVVVKTQASELQGHQLHTRLRDQ